MKIDNALLKTQLDYTYWASDRLLDAARPLSEDELTRDLGNSFGGVLGTLVHIFQGDRVWLSRVSGSAASDARRIRVRRGRLIHSRARGSTCISGGSTGRDRSTM